MLQHLLRSSPFVVSLWLPSSRWLQKYSRRKPRMAPPSAVLTHTYVSGCMEPCCGQNERLPELHINYPLTGKLSVFIHSFVSHIESKRKTSHLSSLLTPI